MRFALPCVDYVFFDIGFNHKKRFPGSTNIQSFSLALRKVVCTLVFADDFPIYNVILRLFGIVGELFFLGFELSALSFDIVRHQKTLRR